MGECERRENRRGREWGRVERKEGKRVGREGRERKRVWE